MKSNITLLCAIALISAGLNNPASADTGLPLCPTNVANKDDFYFAVITDIRINCTTVYDDYGRGKLSEGPCQSVLINQTRGAFYCYKEKDKSCQDIITSLKRPITDLTNRIKALQGPLDAAKKRLPADASLVKTTGQQLDTSRLEVIRLQKLVDGRTKDPITNAKNQGALNDAKAKQDGIQANLYSANAALAIDNDIISGTNNYQKQINDLTKQRGDLQAQLNDATDKQKQSQPCSGGGSSNVPNSFVKTPSLPLNALGM